MRLLYCAVSTHLALGGRPGFPQDAWWCSTDPAVHLDHAVTRDSEALIRDLSVKCHTARTSASPARATEADAAGHTPGPGPVLWWAARLDRQRGAAGPAPELADVPTVCRALVDWLHRNRPGLGISALRLWFAEESVHLAVLGGYTNPARNDVDPLSHLAWALRQRPTTVIRDLLDKSREQFHLRKSRGGRAAQTALCTGLLARAVSWSGLPASLPPGAPRTAVPAHWAAWCREVESRGGDEGLWPAASEALRRSAVALVQRERDLVVRP
jgi:hypothetical protein